MANNIIYPEGYQVIPEIVICSNKGTNGTQLISMGNVIPVIFGKGLIPIVWLYMKVNDIWETVVSGNTSNSSQVTVIMDQVSRNIIVKTIDIILIDATMINDNSCVVNKLDLRPIGFNIYGDNTELQLGGIRLSGNGFNGSKFMIGTD